MKKKEGGGGGSTTRKAIAGRESVQQQNRRGFLSGKGHGVYTLEIEYWKVSGSDDLKFPHVYVAVCRLFT